MVQVSQSNFLCCGATCIEHFPSSYGVTEAECQKMAARVKREVEDILRAGGNKAFFLAILNQRQLPSSGPVLHGLGFRVARKCKNPVHNYASTLYLYVKTDPEGRC